MYFHPTSTGVRNNSALAIATLQVVGTSCDSATFPYFHMQLRKVPPPLSGESSQFSCWPVSCPPLYSSGVDNTCTVQWSAPWTVDCAPLTSYTITVTRRDNGEVVSSSFQSPSDSRMHDVIVPGLLNATQLQFLL